MSVRRAIPALVAAATLVLAAVLYARFLDVSRFLWADPAHDRNGHYWMGLSFAIDLRQGDVLRFVSDFDKAQVWPPLHGLLVAAALLTLGIDHRHPVVPSLVVWIGTVLVGFVLAKRMAPRNGRMAGLVAALFIIASPAHRLYATDVMVESLGAFLSLACLALHLRAIQGGLAADWPGGERQDSPGQRPACGATAGGYGGPDRLHAKPEWMAKDRVLNRPDVTEEGTESGIRRRCKEGRPRGEPEDAEALAPDRVARDRFGDVRARRDGF